MRGDHEDVILPHPQWGSLGEHTEIHTVKVLGTTRSGHLDFTCLEEPARSQLRHGEL